MMAGLVLQPSRSMTLGSKGGENLLKENLLKDLSKLEEKSGPHSSFRPTVQSFCSAGGGQKTALILERLFMPDPIRARASTSATGPSGR
jgi:hypothetical protein